MSLAQAKTILARLPGVKVSDPDKALSGIRPRRDYDNDFVLVGLRLPKPDGKTVVLPKDVLQVFAEARRAVHPEYLQILVLHADRVWVFDRGMLLDVTDDAGKQDADTRKRATSQAASRANPSQASRANPSQAFRQNPVARELLEIASYTCGHEGCRSPRHNPPTRHNPETPRSRPAQTRTHPTHQEPERFFVVDESGQQVSQPVEGRRAANLLLYTMRNMQPGRVLDIEEIRKEMVNPARRR